MDASGGKLEWLARRLATMSPAEVAWRTGQLSHGLVAPVTERAAARRSLPASQDDETWRRWWEAFRRADDRPVLLDRARAERIAAEHPDEVRELVETAEQVLEGRVRYFGHPTAVLSRPVDWHHDALQGYDWPRTKARRIDHRTAEADPKWIWELNRLQHLPWLAEAWLFTGREEFAEGAFEHLDSWLEQNPVGVGIAWRGAFESGLRAISVLVAVQGLRDSPSLTLARFRRIVTMLEASGRACWRERSRFSSANNHLVGELAGLATIGLLLPELPRADRWVQRAVRGLAEQADLQILPDGAGAEQAVGYQMFTVELLLTVLVLTTTSARGRGDAVLEACVTRSTAYLSALVGTDDPDPRYGDDDGGFALRLGPEGVRTVRDHLALVGAYGRSEPVRGLPAAWVSACTAGSGRHPVESVASPGSLHAPDGGLVVLRAGAERVTVDVGPLGHLALAAHGHADALGITLALDGNAVIDDPGMASYYGHPAWRTAHRSTAAHATVMVDDEDQSVMGGPFLWSQHARVTVREVDLERGVVDAEHDGYQRLDEPVTHRRRVEISPTGDGLVLIDELRGSGRHRCCLSWPLAPDLTSVVVPDGHLVSRHGQPLVQVATAATVPLDHDHVVGDERTQHGWWSDRLESRRPAYLLRSRGEGPVPLAMVTVIRRLPPSGDPAVSDVAVTVRDGEVTATWQEEGSKLARTFPVVDLPGGNRKH